MFLLQVQTLQKFVGLQNEAERESGFKDCKVEDAVRELEVRYRKIVISLHSAAQQQRIKDMKVCLLITVKESKILNYS